MIPYCAQNCAQAAGGSWRIICNTRDWNCASAAWIVDSSLIESLLGLFYYYFSIEAIASRTVHILWYRVSFKYVNILHSSKYPSIPIYWNLTFVSILAPFLCGLQVKKSNFIRFVYSLAPFLYIPTMSNIVLYWFSPSDLFNLAWPSSVPAMLHNEEDTFLLVAEECHLSTTSSLSTHLL